MAVRTGMQTLITDLRTLTAASEDELSNQELQDILDKNKREVREITLFATRTGVSGGVIYRIYAIPEEAGRYFEVPIDDTLNDYFYLTDSIYTPFTFGDGANQAVFDPNLRRIVFNSDTQGKIYYLTAQSYDFYGAAADVIQIMCANRADMVDIKTDNHTLALSQAKDAVCGRFGEFANKSYKYGNTRIVRTDQGLNYANRYSKLRRFSHSFH